MKFGRANRQVHRWATVVVAAPVLVVIVTGMLLQWKRQSDWIQPPTAIGSGSIPEIGFEQILSAARSVEEAGITGWDDVDRLDVRPGKGVVKVRSNTRWEVQVDVLTGEVLQAAFRRSDLIESLHDGSFFHKRTTLWVFFPASVVLLVMWLTGIYLFLLPYIAKHRRRARRRATGGPQ